MSRYPMKRFSEKSKRCTHFTYTLKDCNSVFEVAYMKYWYNQLDVRIMANTLHRREATSFTKGILLSCSLYKYK
jgi:hypothetical protein